MGKKLVLSILSMVLLMLVNPGNCGLTILANSSFLMVIDGVGEGQQPDFIVLEHWPSSDLSSYSQRINHVFRPGSIFLILVYISLMLFAAKLLYDGSELLLQVASPRITGGLFLPLLASLLDAIISFVSNLCGNKETAENENLSSARTGLLTGSTAMLLVLLGGSCIINGSALRTDHRTCYSARIMVISVMPFISVQLSHVLSGTSPICFAALASLVVSVSVLLAYCHYQVFHPSILKSCFSDENPLHIHWTLPLERFLLRANGRPDVQDIRKQLFQVIGGNSDDQLLSAINGAVGDPKINVDVFIKEISKWLNEGRNSSAVCSSDSDLKTRLVVEHFSSTTKIENNPNWTTTTKAVMMLALGSLVTAIFADPLEDSVRYFSATTNVPPFLVSFAALPFALSSEAVVLAAIYFSSQNKSRISLTFSKIYGAASMNNLLCLSVFLGLLYFRHTTWNFTSEQLIILIVWSFLPRNMR